MLGAIGVGVGALTGIVGIGGGFLIVPALVVLGGLGMREASVASLLVIPLSCASGLAGYLGRVELVWSVIIPFAAVAAGGVVAGALFAERISHRTLQRVFSVALVCSRAICS